jgi:golgi to ER traffic protein 4
MTGRRRRTLLPRTSEHSLFVVRFRTYYFLPIARHCSSSGDSYLLNGNILAARAFLSAFISRLPLDQAPFQSTAQQTPITFSTKTVSSAAEEDSIILTGVPVLNFTQLAVRVCQRADDDRNKTIRETWIRLCGTYQSKGGLLATKEVRSVLNELAELYFAIPRPKAQNANPLGDMLAGMFGGPPSSASTQQRRAITPNKGMGLD